VYKKANSYERIVMKFDIEDNSRYLTQRPTCTSLLISTITC